MDLQIDYERPVAFWSGAAPSVAMACCLHTVQIGSPYANAPLQELPAPAVHA
jgi:hypothetical protein